MRRRDVPELSADHPVGHALLREPRQRGVSAVVEAHVRAGPQPSGATATPARHDVIGRVGIELPVLAVPRKQEMVTLGKAQAGAPVRGASPRASRHVSLSDGFLATFSYSCRDTREFRETFASWLMFGKPTDCSRGTMMLLAQHEATARAAPPVLGRGN